MANVVPAANPIPRNRFERRRARAQARKQQPVLKRPKATRRTQGQLVLADGTTLDVLRFDGLSLDKNGSLSLMGVAVDAAERLSDATLARIEAGRARFFGGATS